MLDLERYVEVIDNTRIFNPRGRLSAIHTSLLEAKGCDVQMGELVEIFGAKSESHLIAEVVGLKNNNILLMPYGSSEKLCLDSEVVPTKKFTEVPVTEKLLGRIVDALGNPIDEKESLGKTDFITGRPIPINPLKRITSNQQLITGVKAVDLFTPVAEGQRIGIFSGSGVGKSTLLGMMSRNNNADVVVIALIGERGREVNEFVYDVLGSNGLKKSIVVAATADQPAVCRRRAAYTATAIASWYRDKNYKVMLIMDSITRLAMAQREIGLSIGEQLGSRGYPASIFTMLPRLVEACGKTTGSGSITAIYTVLVEGDDFNEPIADTMRSILDGHIILARHLAAKGQYPAISVSESISRLADKVLTDKQQEVIGVLKKLIAAYDSARDMIEIGAYEKGSNSELDKAIEFKPELDDIIQQSVTSTNDHYALWKSAEHLAHRITKLS